MTLRLLKFMIISSIFFVALQTPIVAQNASGINYTASYPNAVNITQQTQNGVVVSPVSWGADPTCNTDSTVAWNKMQSDIGPGTTIDIAGACYLIGTNNPLPQNVTIRGGMGYGDPFLAATAGGVQTSPYTWGGQIRRVRGTTFTATNGDRFQNVVFIRQGLLPAGVTFPLQNASQANAVIANFGDNAIDSNQASIEIEHSTFLGFTWALYATNSGGGALSNKVRFDYNLVDGVNGVYAGYSGDPALISRNHIFPFLTIAAPGVGTGSGQSSAPMQRSGIAFYLQGPDTGTRLTENLEFGFRIGLQCSACSQVNAVGNHFENIGGANANVGMSFTGQYLQAMHNFIIGYTYPVYLDGLTSPTGENNPTGNDQIDFAHNQIVASSGSAYCANLHGGWGNISNNLMQNCPVGLRIDTAATGGIIAQNRFVGSASPIVNNYIGSGLSVISNAGYNPRGPKVVTVTTGTFTYSAGVSPETIYLWAGTVSAISVSGRGIFVNSTGQTIDLSPGEALSITSSSAPTMISDVH